MAALGGPSRRQSEGLNRLTKVLTKDVAVGLQDQNTAVAVSQKSGHFLHGEPREKAAAGKTVPETMKGGQLQTQPTGQTRSLRR
jgi:hypothetical protein